MTDEQPAVAPGPGEEPRSRSAFWKELVILVAVTALVSFVVKTFLVETFYIPSGSMEHTLDINDRVLVNKLGYHFRDPARGEIIVFEAPQSWRLLQSDKDFIKRVIGVGGDHVVCCDAQGRITVNGVALNEQSYLFRDVNGVSNPPSRDAFDIVVPADRLWVMGDHRSESGDSRENFVRTGDVRQATIPVNAVVGRAFVLFWPFGRFTWFTVPATFHDIPKPGA